MLGRPEAGLVAFCIASGNSLTTGDVELVKAWRFAAPNRIVVTVNNTYELCHWADYLVAMDGKWWNVYGDKVAADFTGKKYSQFSNRHADKGPFRFFGNSGASALACAAHAGARTILMLGYDCKVTSGKTHWHGSHVRPLTDAKSMPQWPKAFQRVKQTHSDVQIYNCTRATALDVFPLLELEKAISL
jgi:hypothetical protein